MDNNYQDFWNPNKYVDTLNYMNNENSKEGGLNFSKLIVIVVILLIFLILIQLIVHYAPFMVSFFSNPIVKIILVCFVIYFMYHSMVYGLLFALFVLLFYAFLPRESINVSNLYSVAY